MINTYLYVIAASDQGPVKIGFSTTPDRRVKQLQTGHAHPLILFFSQLVPDEQARRIEKAIHTTIGYRRLKGEWFNIKVDEAIAEVQFGLMSVE